jgi:hypothetical protein
MNRLFKIARRRPSIVDLYTPFTYGVDGYRLKWAANFDGVFATALTSTNVGYLDPSINQAVLDAQPTNGKDVRIVFNPATYSIPDANSFWLKFVPVTGGVEGTAGAATLVLPDSAHHGVGDIVIAGNAPNGSTVQVDLPLVQDIRVTNKDGATTLLVASESGGPFSAVLPKVGEQSMGFYGTQGSLYFEGSGGVVAFSATFTLAFPR